MPDRVEVGIEEGAECNRGYLKACSGVIMLSESENCSCHLGHPPCSSCTSVYHYCPVCDWDEDEDAHFDT